MTEECVPVPALLVAPMVTPVMAVGSKLLLISFVVKVTVMVEPDATVAAEAVKIL